MKFQLLYVLCAVPIVAAAAVSCGGQETAAKTPASVVVPEERGTPESSSPPRRPLREEQVTEAPPEVDLKATPESGSFRFHKQGSVSLKFSYSSTDGGFQFQGSARGADGGVTHFSGDGGGFHISVSGSISSDGASSSSVHIDSSAP